MLRYTTLASVSRIGRDCFRRRDDLPTGRGGNPKEKDHPGKKKTLTDRPPRSE